MPDDDRRERGDLALGAELDQVVKSHYEDRMKCTAERDVVEREGVEVAEDEAEDRGGEADEAALQDERLSQCSPEPWR